MRRYYDSVEIAELLGKMVISELSEGEKKRLAMLISANNLNNKQDLEKIINQAIPVQPDTVDVQKREKILASIQEKIRLRKRQHKRRMIIRYAAAAAILVFAVVSTVFRNQRDTVPEPAIKLIASQEAVIEYPSGQEVILPKEANVATMLLAEDTVKAEIEKPQIYTVKVPLGTSHTLTLEDGTRVVLFPGSELKFPAHFSKTERLVTLLGEAYFDVAREEVRQFNVQAREASVTVLGTSFNIRAYEDEGAIETVLVSGLVDINNTLLQPGQMAVYSQNNQNLNIHEVDASIYRERANGIFVFDDKTLDQIMHDLSLWFDFEYTYSDEAVKDERFRFKLPRTEDFETIMDMMKFTGVVSFEITDQHVEILPGKKINN